MQTFKSYMAKSLIGKKLHFKCECIFPIDKIGTIVDYKIVSNEIVFTVDVGGKIISLGENHPNLYVESL